MWLDRRGLLSSVPTTTTARTCGVQLAEARTAHAGRGTGYGTMFLCGGGAKVVLHGSHWTGHRRRSSRRLRPRALKTSKHPGLVPR
uniref:Uncharacterized protein n=1 Tax=Triticum urartu TaxID=4572 RepID=A0A8R7TLL9_TRIUA